MKCKGKKGKVGESEPKVEEGEVKVVECEVEES